jgi:hypothetical protein
MYMLRIEHPVPDWAAWKQAFDSDPAQREKSGVRRYRILRAADDPNYVLIDLEFDNGAQAEGLLQAMRRVWSHVTGRIMFDPRARIAELVENREY